MEVSLSEGRYDRQELISWWDQSLLRAARVLVVGAGALGNEVVKNLLLVGVGNIDVLDLDTIERSNLARCVFFRETDEGRPKAEVIAEAARGFNPDCRVTPHVGNVMHLGVSWVQHFDLVIGALDNREARLWINQVCRKFGVTWIDGAIEGIRGVVKVFPPVGACYECTLGEQDRAILAKRRSCSLLTTDEMLTGKVPTTATMASVVGGLEVQEAIRLLHSQESPIANSGWTFIGETFDSYVVSYGEDEFCLSHDSYGSTLSSVEMSSSLEEIVQAHVPDHSDQVVIDFEREILRSSRCEPCGWSTVIERALFSVAAEEVICPSCHEEGALEIATVVDHADPLLAKTLNELALPAFDVITLRAPNTRIHLSIGAPS